MTNDLSGSDTFLSVDIGRLGDCLQKAPYGIFITNETGIILFMTDAISEMAGYIIQFRKRSGR